MYVSNHLSRHPILFWKNCVIDGLKYSVVKKKLLFGFTALLACIFHSSASFKKNFPWIYHFEILYWKKRKKWNAVALFQSKEMGWRTQVNKLCDFFSLSGVLFQVEKSRFTNFGYHLGTTILIINFSLSKRKEKGSCKKFE